MAIGFYCLGTLDLTGYAERKITPTDRENWKKWIWAQYIGTPLANAYIPSLTQPYGF